MRFCTRSCVLICTTSTIFSTIRSEVRSCGITLTRAASESYRRFALLCVVNVDFLDHLLRFFVREFLTHICHYVTLILCKMRLSSDFALTRNGQLFALQSSTARLSLSVIALSTPLSFNVARWFTTADNSVFTFVSVFSRVLSCALNCSCVQLLDRCTLIRHLLGRWRRLQDVLLRNHELVGRHALGRRSSPLCYHAYRKTCLLSCLCDAS